MRSKAPWVIKDRKISIALVGCGRISKNHLQAIKAHQDHLDLVGLCDTDPQALGAAIKEYNVAGFTSLDEMLQAIQPDLVALCTPSGLHPKQAIQIAGAGCHVLTEKPMATCWEDGINMVNACDAAGVRLFVVKQNRLNATLQLLKKAVDQGRFGKIYMTNINVFWTRPEEYYAQGGWRGTWALDGGAFMNQASHYIDLIHWLLGPVASVHAMTGTLARQIEAEDTGTLSIRWRNGAIGSVNVTMLTYPKNFEGSITILGEKGTVRIGGVAVNEIQHWVFADEDPEDEAIKNANYQTTSVYGFGHPLYYNNVIKTLQGIEEPLTDGREGLTSLELLIAAYRSARNGNTVHLPLEVIKMKYTAHETAIIDEGATIGADTRIWHWAHVSAQAIIGASCSLGQNVYIGNKVVIGHNVKIQNNVSVYDNVVLEDDVFCGPSMVFTNVYNPRSAVSRKEEYRNTLVKKGATLGANCTIVCGVTIGEYAFIGAGAVVNKDVPPYALMVGVPARHIGWMSEFGEQLHFKQSQEGIEVAQCSATGVMYTKRGALVTKAVAIAAEESV
jgi:UDP-N-acetyl-2-amino-2-deoxyglucuronate dehydrogenase